MKRGRAKICWNWKEIGFPEEETVILEWVIRTSTWEQEMWEYVLSPWPHTIQHCSCSSANVCLMPNSLTAQRTETDEQRLSRYIKGTWLGILKSTPASADQGTPEPPWDFAPSFLCSLTAKVEWNRLRSAGFGVQFTCTDDISKCSSTNGEDLQG